jgi:phosphoribosylaminoimidazolecarboxamide formyltransferase/IMP cyclohydrolase
VFAGSPKIKEYQMNQTSPFILKRALLSVSDKRGIVTLAIALHNQGVELVATGNTAALLKENGLPITEVSTCTGFPELLAGRVKTLHPAIHAGLLAATDQDLATLTQYNILPFDLLVVNLYPFEQVIQNEDCTFEEAIENIDIGGPAMLRAAAKNHQHIAVVVTPDDYSLIMQYASERLAPSSFQFTLDQSFPNYLTQQYRKQYDLRYGENPHQQGVLYVDHSSSKHALARAELIQGKKLSYNNLLDADAAFTCARDFPTDEPVCVIVKHGNPCGIAKRDTQTQAYLRAFETDPVSCYGGILSFNHCLQAETVIAILEKQFVEVIIAPAITNKAREILSRKENIRVLLTGDIQQASPNQLEIRGIDGGVLMQDQDRLSHNEISFQTVTTLKPNPQQISDLIFSWRAVKQVKSNAIVLAKNEATIGIGAGQTSRVMSTRIALWQAEAANFSIEDTVMASDAFIPFADSIELAQQKGIRAIIQPGGSIRDEEMISIANDLGLVMLFTGVRHFKH